MTKAKNVFTAGDVAKICNVASRTVHNWFDRGLLKGYVLPDGSDRRIPPNELKVFMETHNIPIPEDVMKLFKENGEFIP